MNWVCDTNVRGRITKSIRSLGCAADIPARPKRKFSPSVAPRCNCAHAAFLFLSCLNDRRIPRQTLANDTRSAVGGVLYLDSNLRRRNWYRSEEHTSELQSRLHLVCRLLLEKKKK